MHCTPPLRVSGASGEMGFGGELSRGRPDPHISTWVGQLEKTHIVQDHLKVQNLLICQHHACVPLKDKKKIDFSFILICKVLQFVFPVLVVRR